MQTQALFDNIANRIQQELEQAEESIYIAVAWFTNRTLFDVLVAKAQRGVSVHLLCSNDPINHKRLRTAEYRQLLRLPHR